MCENWWWIQAMPLLSLLWRADCFVLLHIFRVDFFLLFFLYNVTVRRKMKKEAKKKNFFGFRISIEFFIFLSLVMCYNEKSLTLLSSPRISSFLFSFSFWNMQLKRSLAAREKFSWKRIWWWKMERAIMFTSPSIPTPPPTSQQRLSLFSTLENVVIAILPPL